MLPQPLERGWGGCWKSTEVKKKRDFDVAKYDLYGSPSSQIEMGPC